MPAPYSEYRTRYIKGFDVILAFVIGLLVSLYSLYIIFREMDTLAVLIYLIPASLFPLFLIFTLTNKVRFGDDYIETSTIFGKRRINIADVKRWGVYQSGKFKAFEMHEADITRPGVEGNMSYMIYLFPTPDFDLKSLQSKSAVSFPFRMELYRKVKEILDSRK